ncbi:MAG: hypothetical protein MJE77_45025 [Proteobacteria bacterium]|nr:hypothetical protein [Pseudomonadota bacterium]
MSLLELMVSVAIVGILAATAVFLYTRQLRAARATEVPAVIAEFKSRQEQYHVENGRFLTTGDGETDYWPTAPSGPKVPTSIQPMPETWLELNIKLGKNELYCAYVAITGRAGEETGAVAQSFGVPAAPATDWYYLLAECDFDGEPTNSLYFTSNLSGGIAVRDRGR